MSKEKTRKERRKRSGSGAVVAWALGVGLAAPAAAVPLGANGYVALPSIPTPDAATGGVLVVGEHVFVGQGQFGAPQSVVRITNGTATTLATGFASLSGMAYDPVNDRLIVGDNDVAPSGAGDTLFAIPDPFGDPGTPPDASSLRLAPDGTTPGVQDVFLDPGDPTGQTLLISNSISPDLVQRVDVSVFASPVLTTLQMLDGFAGGVVADTTADALYFGDAFGPDGSLVLEAPLSDPTATALQVGGALGGQFDLALDAAGLLYSTSFTEVVRIDPATGETLVVATGFAFSTAIDEAGDRLYVLDSGAPEIFVFAVPEPSTFGAVALGLLALGASRLRRR